ncbi:response regulator transcription factor [Actinocorallia sp. A-T 12471]|uniref:response regulator transcription factor n=1 Tax=Actinocorallia sp. A-T 12471 TaxID=3089813 RepID=UPI0029CDA85D|nr:response regulator transcription factor [Actinocorallia sp. A-T 12471]MDX6738307.1 response regulator transcription factor [Actinocorallia sp. A-T 12471]
MIRVVVAEDMDLIRGALVALLGLEGDLEVVGEARTGREAVEAAVGQRADVAVLDVHMPGEMDGIEAAAEIVARAPGCRVLMLTSAGRPETLRRALASRADGFVLKDIPPQDLAAAIRRVAAGDRVVDPQLAAEALALRPNPLTDREAEVLRMAASGADNDEIAAALFLSRGTVRNYLAATVTKLGARNRLDAVRIATEAGWL